MKIPAFWAKAEVVETDRQGKRLEFGCWRSSQTSQEDAHRSALEAARRVAQRVIAGEKFDKYLGYDRRPLREELIQELQDDQGNQVAAVTQNAYGCLVLNTAQVMFIDIDLPDAPPGERLKSWFLRLFGKQTPEPVDVQAEAIEKLQQLVDREPGFGLRVYRTAAGLRGLVTHKLIDPCTDATRAIFESVEADPLYVSLCKVYECFRARLTPKPWRIGHHANTIRWPRETPDRQAAFERWQAEYLTAQAPYATCRYLATLGSEAVYPEIAPIVELHDRLSYAQATERPLA